MGTVALLQWVVDVASSAPLGLLRRRLLGGAVTADARDRAVYFRSGGVTK